MSHDHYRQNNNYFFDTEKNLSYFMQTPPVSWAIIKGSRDYPQINGTVWFYQLSKGTLVIAEINGLPKSDSPCENSVFAIHIHEGNSCNANMTAPPPQPQPPQRPTPQPQPPQRPTPQPQPPQRPTPQPQPPQRPTPQPQPPQRPTPQPQPPQRPTPQPQPPQRPTPQPQPPQRPTPQPQPPQRPTFQIIPIFPPFSNQPSENNTPNYEPFPNSGTHYNPNRCPHPYHAGDMPPLFSANGYAFLSFVSNRFTAKEVRGRTVIIHSSPDDFTTQPSGNSGTKIACGVIEPS